jgi:RHS repeat-associated protein
VIALLLLVMGLSAAAQAQSVMVNKVYGEPCVGREMVFVLTGSNCTGTYWSVYGSNYTIVTQSATSIQVRWNSVQSGVGVTASYSCSEGWGTAYSPTFYIDAAVTPAVSISASATTICQGQSVTFTAAPTNGGGSPYYQWFVNGSSVAGNTNMNRYTTTGLTNGQVVTCSMSTSAPCYTQYSASSNGITMTVTPANTVGITISSSSLCVGDQATFSANITNGGSNPVYQWRRNGYNISSDVVGPPPYVLVNSTIVAGDVITCELTSNATCVSSIYATSNAITVAYQAKLTPAVSISANTTACPTKTVTFTATPTNGGAAPIYNWQINEAAAPGATNSPTYTTSGLADGQRVRCIMTTNLACYTTPTATSNTIHVSPYPVDGTIAASRTTICLGESVTITSAGGNGSPYYWCSNDLAAGWNVFAGQYAGQYSFQHTPTAPGTYRYHLRNRTACGFCHELGSCATYPSVDVTVLAPPAAPEAFGNATMPALPNSSIVSSSCWDGCAAGGHEAWRGRLFDQSGASNWSALTNDVNQYLQVDLGAVKPVDAILSQGRYNCCDQWVTAYKVAYSVDGTGWTEYPQTFAGNTNRTGVVRNNIANPFPARYVRIKPTTWNGHITMRAEIISLPNKGGSTTFIASQPAGANTNRWYPAATGGPLLHTGTSYTTPLNQNVTLYVSSYNTVTGCESTTRTAVTGSIRASEQDQNLNFVITHNVQVSGVKTSEGVEHLSLNTQRKQQTSYLDDLGRPVQQVSKGVSPGGLDAVSFIELDAANREVKKYLPYTGGSDGRFKTGAATAQATFYLNQKGDNKAFAESRFDNSPLNRVLEQGAPGTPWQLAATPATGKTRKMAYGNNLPGEIRMWTFNATTHTATGTATYSANALYYTQETDEHGMKLLEYKDKSGKTICKKVQRVAGDEASYIFTYYVYDDFGNLRFTVPPEAVNNLAAVNFTFAYNDAFCQRWLFAYQYDARFRTTEKSVPGGGITWLVYDPADRVILMQDAARRPGNGWFFTKYDALGRKIMTGRYTYTATSQAQMQTAVDNYYAGNAALKYFENRSNADFANQHGYTNQAFPVMPLPNGAAGQPYEVKYYDDYDFDFNGAAGETAKGEPLFVNFGGNYPAAPARARGKATGTRVLVLNTGTWLTSALYYNTEGRVFQTQSENYNTAGIVPTTRGRNIEVVTSELDFVGRVIRTERRHCYGIGDNASNLVVKQRFEYDQVGRVKASYVQVNSQAEERIASNTYNELGEQTRKVVGNGTGLQAMDYKYNIRGWLKSINDGVVPTKVSANDDLFAMSFNYQDGGTAPQHNGNIARMDWKSQSDYVQRTYNYSYNGLNQLLSATYSSDVAAEKFSVNNLTYDLNGNLKSLDRQNLISRAGNAADNFDFVDRLQYGHDGNRLTTVEDAITATAAATSFKEKSRITTNPVEYTYDPAGRLTIDKNRGITGTLYNDLDLPATLNTSATDYISTVYDASGNKWQWQVTTGGSVTKTVKYIGGVVYLNNVPQFIPIEGGRILSPQASGAGAWAFEYHYRDHLGNLRVAFRQMAPVPPASTSLEEVSNPAWSNASSPVRNGERASAGLWSAKLVPANPLGPWKTIKVGKGDVITVAARASYTTDPTNNSAVNLGVYVSGLPAQSPESGNVPRLLNVGLSVNPFAVNGVSATIPKAYLSYILQTGDEAVTQSKRYYITAAAKGAWEPLSMTYTAETDGYFQVLVANESDQAVWFDEVSVSVTPSMIVQETHYDPWGLELAGIERRNNPEHPHKFQGKELSEDLSLYLMDFGARYYDPVLGRWHTVDPADQFGSPYLAMGNNPVVSIDPDGKEIITAILIGAAIGAAVSGATYTATALAAGSFNGRSFVRSLAFGAVGGAIGGGLGALGTSLGAFGQSIGYNVLSNVASNVGTNLAFGNNITAGTIIGSAFGGFIGGAMGGFSGVPGGAVKNALAEVGFNTFKGAFTGAFGGTLGAAVDGRDMGEGFENGVRYGAIGGAVSSAVMIATFGAAIVPDESVQQRLAKVEAHFARQGLSKGIHDPVYRRGGLYATFQRAMTGGYSRGVTWLRSLVVPDGDSDTYVHETIHYYQQIKDGFGGFYGKSIYNILYLESIKGKSPYDIPGNYEFEADRYTEFFK